MLTKVKPRLVVDTNVLISRLLLPSSIAAKAVNVAIDDGQLLASSATMMELAGVLSRPKLDRYISVEDRQQFLRLLGRSVELVSIHHRIRACRDPKDDAFLELAINGRAAAIITGDEDLLVLHPFREIPILTPSAYLKSREEPASTSS